MGPGDLPVAALLQHHRVDQVASQLPRTSALARGVHYGPRHTSLEVSTIRKITHLTLRYF
jgi:hypothetical protein